MAASDLVRVALFYRAPEGVGSWHGHDLSLVDGWPALFGRTGGQWWVPHGFQAVFVTVPRAAVPLPDAAIDRIADRQHPQRSPVFETMVRPMFAD